MVTQHKLRGLGPISLRCNYDMNHFIDTVYVNEMQGQITAE